MTYITGRADPSKLPRKLKSGKYADICWVKTGNHIMYVTNTGQGMTMEQPPPAPYNWHNHYSPSPPPPHHHHHHHMLPHYQQQRPSIAYPYDDYPQYVLCFLLFIQVDAGPGHPMFGGRNDRLLVPGFPGGLA
ncbi:hypothetical protein Q3G72_021099 [Acer saccharum]|nr:hypothetical protein Q3G72_021099 [Acer saccharum]